MEYISREELLKSLTQECKDCEHDDPYWCEQCDFAIAMLYARYAPKADVQPVNKWVSIKDKLPDEDGAYLCYLESGIVCEANYDSTVAAEGKFPFGEWVTYYNSDTLGAEDNYWEAYDAITHWMPLPEPPKDGDINEND